jgi:hypothetical protein
MFTSKGHDLPIELTVELAASDAFHSENKVCLGNLIFLSHESKHLLKSNGLSRKRKLLCFW